MHQCFFDKEQTCIVNEASCECMEHADPESVSDFLMQGSLVGRL